MSYCGPIPGTCGKRADCADHHCPGRAMAPRMHQADGGHVVHAGAALPLDPPVATPEEVQEDTLVFFGALAVLVLAFTCWAVFAAYGVPLSLPF